MIFVTVGTHEQQFNRLVKAVDELKGSGDITEDVIIQTGYSDYKPQNCEYSQFYSYEQMNDYVKEARIVITHGGPSSFITPLQMGKIPIVVPREKEFGEHVNNHQVEFCQIISESQKNILLIQNINQLKEMIKNYDLLTGKMVTELKSNNANFCAHLEQIVDEMFYE